MDTKNKKRVVIVGGGFAGIAAARALHGSDTQVTLIDRNNYHLFAPLLYQVASGSVSPENILSPLRDVLGRRSRATVLMGNVERIDPREKTIQVGEQILPYDALVVASGTATSYFGNAAWATHAHGLKNLDDAMKVRRQVLWALEQAERCDDPAIRQAFLTFVVVGGGPTGVEMAGALANLLTDLRRVRFTHIDPRQARIFLVDSGARLLATYAPPLSLRAAAKLQALGVKVVSNTRVTDVEQGRVRLGTGTASRWVQSRTVVWAAGMQASPLGAHLAACTGAEVTRQGRLRVAADMSLPSAADIFVVGDLAAIADPRATDGRALPAVAPVATQAGRFVGQLLRRRFAGRQAPPPFVYRDLGSMAVIGRGSAVVDLYWMSFSGAAAFIAWLAVHLGQLHGKLNKLFVGLQWLMSFVVKRPAARAIFGQGASPARALAIASKLSLLPGGSATLKVRDEFPSKASAPPDQGVA